MPRCLILSSSARSLLSVRMLIDVGAGAGSLRTATAVATAVSSAKASMALPAPVQCAGVRPPPGSGSAC